MDRSCAATPTCRSFVDGAPADHGPQRRHDRRHRRRRRTCCCRTRPPAAGRSTTKLDVSTLTNAGEQAGFVLWQSENPNTFAKITYISKGTSQQYEWVATRNNGGPTSRPARRSRRRPTDVYLRVSANGAGHVHRRGLDRRRELDADRRRRSPSSATPETLKFGLKVSDTQNSTNRYAAFDYFRVDCSDKIAPATTATLDEPVPDGELGWYTDVARRSRSTADDGAGDGVDKVEYSVDGGAKQTYDGAVHGRRPTASTSVEYFATDKAENVEAPKRLAFRVDATAPETTGSDTSADPENGPGDGHAQRRGRRRRLGTVV